MAEGTVLIFSGDIVEAVAIDTWMVQTIFLEDKEESPCRRERGQMMPNARESFIYIFMASLSG